MPLTSSRSTISTVLHVSDTEFEDLIGRAMDELPEHFLGRAQNVAVVWAEEPTEEQRQKLRLRNHESLFGLYEGVPLTRRGTGYNLVLPDKITIFKHPMLRHSSDMSELRHQIKHTLWHEIAHHYGLDHDRIHELEDKD